MRWGRRPLSIPQITVAWIWGSGGLRRNHKYLEKTSVVFCSSETSQTALQTNLGLLREKHAPNDSQWRPHSLATTNFQFRFNCSTTSFPISSKMFMQGFMYVGPGSVVGIATGYGLDGSGIESRWGRNILHLSRPVLGPTQLPVKWVLDLFRG